VYEVFGASPGADDLAVHDHGAGPDTRCPEQIALLGVGHKQLAIGAL
jgi:hypothetical protein